MTYKLEIITISDCETNRLSEVCKTFAEANNKMINEEGEKRVTVTFTEYYDDGNVKNRPSYTAKMDADEDDINIARHLFNHCSYQAIVEGDSEEVNLYDVYANIFRGYLD